MNKALWWAFGLLAVMPLRADWKIRTVQTGQCAGESSRTEYYKGDLRRTDTESGGVRELTIIVNPDGALETLWDSKRKEYVSISLSHVPSPALGAQPEASPVPASALQPVLHIDTNTTDTGERQTFFGRMARHLITTEKRSQQTPGTDAKFESQTTTDGWYIDASGSPMETHGGYVYILALAVVSGQVPVVKPSHTGVALSGFAVLQKVTSRFSGRSIGSEYETEVKEFEEGPLAQTLFEPPNDFRRVDRLSNTSFACKPTLSDEIEAYWNSFESWVFRWFS